MRTRIFVTLICIAYLTSCASQAHTASLPAGVTLLPDIDPTGLQNPIWSPDGRRIVASYVIEASPDIIGMFGSKPRHDIVIIDPDTWKVSILVHENSGSLSAEAWTPDNKSFAMYWSDGPAGHGTYIFQVDDPKPIFLSADWAVTSQDWNQNAANTNSLLRVLNTKTKDVKIFDFPKTGSWRVVAWSPDASQLALIYKEREEDYSYSNIYLLALSSGIFTQLTGDTKSYKATPLFSPNGKLIAYGTSQFVGNDLKSEVVITRINQTCKWTMPLSDINYFTWSPDGQKMFMVGTSGVYIADLKKVFGENFVNDTGCQ